MTPSECSTCHRECAVGIWQGVKIGKRWVTWRLCRVCFLAEQERNAAA